MNNIYVDCFNIYCKLNKALQEGNIDQLAEFISPNLYNEYKEKELYIKHNNLKYIFNIDDAKLNKYVVKPSNEVKLFVSITEYIVDENSNLVSGSTKNIENIVTISYIKDNNHFMSKCDICNNYYKDYNDIKCPSCNNKLLKKSQSLVINTIKKEV